MPRRERRRRLWARADSYFQSVSASSIDGSSESAHCSDESGRNGPADFECCGYEISGFLREQPRWNIGRCSDSSRCRIVLTCAGQSGTNCDGRITVGFREALKTKNRWCGRWELNPHGPCGPADFLTGYGFRRPDIAGLRSGLSLRLIPKCRSLGAARLVSTPS